MARGERVSASCSRSRAPTCRGTAGGGGEAKYRVRNRAQQGVCAEVVRRMTGLTIRTLANLKLAEAQTCFTLSFDKADLPLPPAKGVAVVACMNAHLNVYGMLGL